MAHIIRIENEEHFIEAIRVLNELPGMWHSRGTDDQTELLLLDSHYEALVNAGVISPNGKEGKAHGKKAGPKKFRS